MFLALPPPAPAQSPCPELNRVPNLLGLPLQRAEAALNAMCLRLGRVSSVPSDEPSGMVLRQEPRRAEYLPPYAPVDVVVSERLEVPDLRGLSLEEAERLLASADLRIGRIEERFADVRPETILDQRPAPRQPLPPDGRVDVAVAQSPIVPDLYGLTLEQAERELADRYLGVGRVEQVPSAQRHGTILDQRPRAGEEVAAGARIDLTLAEARTVPDLRGATVTGAEQRLQAQGLRLGSIEYRIADRDPGRIFDQRPRPGERAEANQTVAVVVAEAPAVPDLRGLTLDEAQARLGDQSLRLGQSTREVSTDPPGTILGQSPGAGQRARFGAAVDVRVAEAPVVPDLIGQGADQATALLERQLLELREADQQFSKEPPGTIIDQTPAAGTAAEAGTVVEVTTAKPLRVPDLQGRALEAAEAELGQSSLALGEVTEAVADAAPGTVLGQEPAAGTPALPGEAVSLRVAKAPEVPDLKGLRGAEARAELARNLLALGDLSYEATLDPPLTVVRQDPPPGSPVEARGRVDVVLAVTPPPPTRPDQVDVPEVTGAALEVAAEAVKSAGLILEVANPTAETDVPGRVRDQTPPAGTILPVGSTVRVTADWVEQVALPELEGLQLIEAEPLLRDRFLETGRITYLPARAEPGTILDQEPAAGAALLPGAPIELTVARPPAVPRLLGLPAERAEVVLASELLRLGRVERVISADWPGTIVEQLPPPGARLAPDEVVHVKVANLVAPLTLGGSVLLALLTITTVVRRRPRTMAPAYLRRPGPLRVVIGRDPGLQEVEGPAQALAGPHLSLRARPDRGRQSVEAPLEGDADGRGRFKR